MRLNGVTPPHKRTLAESDRAIRVLLIQEKMAERERALEDDLRKKFPVQIDEGALAAVKVPVMAGDPNKPLDTPDAGPGEGVEADGGH